jgi:hypothetical protein
MEMGTQPANARATELVLELPHQRFKPSPFNFQIQVPNRLSAEPGLVVGKRFGRHDREPEDAAADHRICNFGAANSLILDAQILHDPLAAGRQIPNFLGNGRPLRRRRVGELCLPMRHFLLPMTAAFDFFFSFADAHGSINSRKYGSRSAPANGAR